MKTMPLIQELQKIGLSDKEAKVYLANLELGQQSVQNIARKAKVNRATTYVVLNSLIKKGLVSTYEENKKTYYIAAEPESLEGLFELQKKEIEERQKYFNSMLPQLKLIDNAEKDKPVVKFFEGKQGLINCLVEFLSSYQEQTPDSTARLLYPKDRLDHLFNEEERKKFREIRLKQKVKSKTLYNSEKLELSNTADGVRLKVSGEKYPFTCDIGIHGNSVRILSLGKKLSGILISDAEVARTLKSLFELAWEAAEARSKGQNKKEK